MTNRETWYIFDMRGEDIDPRFINWLKENSIVLLTDGGGAPILAANKNDLPSDYEVFLDNTLPPLYKTVEAVRGQPIADKVLVTYELMPKIEKPLRNPTQIDYGRPRALDLLLGAGEFLAEAKALLGRARDVYDYGATATTSNGVARFEDRVETFKCLKAETQALIDAIAKLELPT